MRSILGKLYQRVTNITLAFLLTISSLSVVGQAFIASPVSALTTPVCVDFTPSGRATQTISPVTISTSDYWQSWNVTLSSGYKLSSTSSYYANVRDGFTPSEAQKSTTHPAYYVNGTFTTQTSTTISNPGASQSASSNPLTYSYYLTTLRVCYLTTDSVAPNAYIKGDGNSHTPTSTGSYVYDTYRTVNFKLNDNSSLSSWSVNGGSSHPASGTWSDANNISVGSNGGVYGPNTLTVYDTTGNSRTINFLLDNVGPTITPKSTSVGSIAVDLYSEVDFKLYDEYLVSSWQVNSGAIHTQTPDQWSDANDISVGTNDGVLGLNTIKVWDVAGNMSTYSFILNNVGPTITVKSSVNGYTPYSIGDVVSSIFSKINFKLYDANKVTQFQINGSAINNVTDNMWSDANNITVGGLGGVYGTNTIRVWDLAGNVSEFTFFLDNIAPVITVTGGDLTIEAGEAYVEQGATWTDDFDGSGVINDADASSDVVDEFVPGVYEIVYSYTDKAGNTGTATRTVNVVDTTAPLVTLNGDSEVTLENGAVYNELGAVWTDIVDGDGTDVEISGSVNTAIAGIYFITYSYTDEEGNVGTATRKVTIKPAPEVLAANIVTTSSTAQTNTGTNETGEVKGDATSTDNNGSVSGASDTNEEESEGTGISDIFGLAWYWWLAILAVLGGLWWFLFGRKKKEDK